MPCPLHKLDTASHCLYCGAFSAGFVAGFSNELSAPGADPDATYEQFQSVCQMLDAAAGGVGRYQNVRDAWMVVPVPARTQLLQEGTIADGGLAAGLVAHQVLLFTAAWLAGRIVAQLPQFRAHPPASLPAPVDTGAAIRMLLQPGGVAQLVQRLQRLLDIHHGCRQALQQLLDQGARQEHAATAPVRAVSPARSAR
ncbi:hypothetical protein [uncultured Ramlibacter sp.]|uniref:hypothetical protein n=1 Tax=uncultured Ramlibacter sp. TaxID=260755 RepID=UPI002629049F|nr:hypothetical protein [uncultured Ramlibacter sp.]